MGACARIRSSSQRLVQRLVCFKIYALAGLTFIGSVAEPDKATIVVENLALKGFRLGLFTHCQQLCCGEGSTCGFKVDADGIQLTSKAACFRVAARSDILSTGMARIRVAKDYDGRTFNSLRLLISPLLPL